MARPWQTIERVGTPEGPLELRQRGPDDFLITIGGRVLMTSEAHRSEDALAQLACAALTGRRRPRVLLGGLGMGFTLRAALDALPKDAQITVAEINPEVVRWCREKLSPLTGAAVEDPRVSVAIVDVAMAIERAPPASLDAIVVDLYEGPHAATQAPDDPLYGPTALARTLTALTPGGVLAVWSEEPDARFERRLAEAGLRAELRRNGRGGRAHVVYLGYNKDRG